MKPFWRKKGSFRKKLIGITIFSIVILSLTFFIGYYCTIQYFNQMLCSQLGTTLDVMSNHLQEYVSGIEIASYRIATASSIQKNIETYLASKQISARGKIQTELLSEIYDYVNNVVTSAAFVFEDDTGIIWGENTLSAYDECLDVIKTECRRAGGRGIWYKHNQNTLIFARQINSIHSVNFLNELGFLIMQVDMNEIIQSVSSHVSSTEPFAIFINDGYQEIYKSHEWNIDGTLITEFDEFFRIINSNGNQFFVSQTSLFEPKWDIFYSVSYDEITQSVLNTVTSVLIVLILSLLVVLIFAILALKKSTKDFDLLVRKIAIVKSGSFDLPTDRLTSEFDELGLLNRYFDEMARNFSRMIDENYRKQLVITETQLKALEQQINPHFLYNTMDTIQWFAKRNGEKNIPVIIEALSHLLSYSLEKVDLIPLEHELEIVRSYMKIQQIRFDDSLSIHYDIDNTLLTCLIPKMSIQPLVENAITYARESAQDNYHIILQVHENNGIIHAEVHNDHSYIDPDILYHIRKHNVEPKGNGIGLMNIDTRIKLLAGEQYGLHFENRNDWAIVWFEFPIGEGGKKYETNDHC